MGNRFNIRIEGTRIKHTMGPVSLKLYDKFGLILRFETTVNDLTFFRHYSEVEHRGGSRETKWASMQKTIDSLPALRELLQAANRRYLEFLSAIEDPRTGRDKLDKLSRTVQQEGRSYPGFNLFDPKTTCCCAQLRAESSTSTVCKTRHFADTCPLVLLGRHRDSSSDCAFTESSKRFGDTYQYYLTEFGKHVTIAGLKLRELVLIPHLAGTPV